LWEKIKPCGVNTLLRVEMFSDFNLIVSCARRLENDACSEIWFLLGEIGDKDPKVETTEVSGLIVAKTSLDPFQAVRKLREMFRNSPEEFRYILKVVPIEAVIPTRLELIEQAAAELSRKIGEDETFRVTVEKRHSDLPTREIIEVAARRVDRKVNLEKPDRILLIEVMGRLTGISVIKPDDILSIAKERRS